MASEAIARPLFEQDVGHLTEAAAKVMGVVVNAREWPVFDVTILHKTPVRLRFTCKEWDALPPSIAFLNPDGSPYTGNVPPGNIFNKNLGDVFICMPGSREYETVGNHHADDWENYRGKDDMTILGIFQKLVAHGLEGFETPLPARGAALHD